MKLQLIARCSPPRCFVEADETLPLSAHYLSNIDPIKATAVVRFYAAGKRLGVASIAPGTRKPYRLYCRSTAARRRLASEIECWSLLLGKDMSAFAKTKNNEHEN